MRRIAITSNVHPRLIHPIICRWIENLAFSFQCPNYLSSWQGPDMSIVDAPHNIDHPRGNAGTNPPKIVIEDPRHPLGRETTVPNDGRRPPFAILRKGRLRRNPYFHSGGGENPHGITTKAVHSRFERAPGAHREGPPALDREMNTKTACPRS